MFSHFVNFESQAYNIEFRRALALHFQNRDKKMEGTIIWFKKEKIIDDNFFAEWKTRYKKSGLYDYKNWYAKVAELIKV